MNLRNSESGTLNVLLIPLILAVIMLLGSIGFGAWAYSERDAYKNRSDEKAAAAVAVAVAQAETKKDNEFLEREKDPLKSYTSPDKFGSFSVKYPKTWSAYANEQSNQFTLLMQPDVVLSNPKTAYVLKIEVLSTSYDRLVTQLDGPLKQGKLTAQAFVLPKVPEVTGLRVDGQISTDKQGAAIYLPLRDKTIRLSAESQDRIADFNNIILPNFEFRP